MYIHFAFIAAVVICVTVFLKNLTAWIVDQVKEQSESHSAVQNKRFVLSVISLSLIIVFSVLFLLFMLS